MEVTSKSSSNVILAVWNISSATQRVKISNVDLEAPVKALRNQASQALAKNIEGENTELSFCGLILEDDNVLSSYGVSDGVTIHVIQKPETKAPAKPEPKVTASELISRFMALVLHPNYRNALQRLARPEVLDSLLTACPELYSDPSVLGILQDPELIFHLANADEAAKMIEAHPVLLTAGGCILKHVQEEQASLNPNVPGTSTGYSYSLDALSDDEEEMDSSDNSFAATQNTSLTRNASFNAITAAQLASAIANATNTQFNTNSAGVPTANSNVITSEMFSNAIQQAIEGGRTAATAAPPPQDGSESWRAQLKQMHEMGLVDDTANIRALRAVNGNVNAAIELVLSLNEME
ncbi:unnamed protein product [Phyllotreta striolata]|uniref:Ubiquitin-like protein 7 n=1 Tax=Phyllotreta striolata TaxID=444603 RepID=A0A9N9TG79_PHYSR|nr:unnamed protein product [Phyllotreta striolata]